MGYGSAIQAMAPPVSHSDQTLLAELSGSAPVRPPVWLMRQAGRYLPEYRALRVRVPDFLEFCYTPELCIEASLQPLQRYGFDAAIIFSDILVVPHALGMPVRFLEGEGPRLAPVRATEDLSRLVKDGIAERLAPVYAAVRGLKAAMPAGATLIGFAGAPWTLACYMIEGTASPTCVGARRRAYAEDGVLTQLIEILSEAVVAHLLAQIDAGAEVVQLFDSWAGVLAEEPFHRLVIEPTRTIVRRVKAKRPSVPIIGFPRGSGVLCQAYVRETGIDVISIDASMPLHWAVDALQPRAAIQGNLDNVLLLEGGRQLESAVERILTTLSAGRFIFNLGHGVLPDTPVAHVQRVVDAVRAFRRR